MSSSDPQASAGSASGSAPPTRLASVSLFDISLSSLDKAPELERADAESYQQWKNKFKKWALSIGVWNLVHDPVESTAREAVLFLAPYGFTAEQAGVKYRNLHQRMWGSITSAIHKAMGDALPNSIEAEQKGDPAGFREYNVHYLWNKIVSTFEKKAGGACLQVLDEFLNLHYDRDENPMQLQQRFEGLLHRWNSIENDAIKAGERMSEGMKYALLVRALPSKLDTVVQAVTATNSSPNVDLLFAAMRRQYEVNITRDPPKTSSSSSSSSASALALTPDEKGTRSRDRRRQRRDSNRKPYRSSSESSSSESDVDGVEKKRRDRAKASHNKPNPRRTDRASDSEDPTNKGEKHVFFSVLSEKSPCDTRELLLDSAATCHIVKDKRLLKSIKTDEPTNVYSFTGQEVKTTGVTGSVQVNRYAAIANVTYVPDATHNLLSLPALLDAGAKVIQINKHSITLKKRNRENGSYAILRFKREPYSKKVWKLVLPELPKCNSSPKLLPKCNPPRESNATKKPDPVDQSFVLSFDNEPF